MIRPAPSWHTRAWRLAPLAPVGAAGVASILLLAINGYDPVGISGLIFRSGFGSADSLADTLAAATPLIATGLATAISFRAGVFNVGVEGCVVLGGLAAVVAARSAPSLPGPVLILMSLMAGGCVGAAWMVVPALLRTRLRVDEVVSTLMLNFVAQFLADGLVQRFLLAPGSANSATGLVPEAARLPLLQPPGAVTAGLPIALVLLGTYAWWTRRSVSGFEGRLVGLSPRFASAVGIPVARVAGGAMIFSGLLGGFAGGLHALGTVHRFVSGFSPGYGFTGIAIAILARNGAAGILAASVLFGALAVAGIGVQLLGGVPKDVVDLLQATILVFASIRPRKLESA